MGRRRWYRFRGYMDQLEEAMRLAGEQLAESELLLSEAWEHAAWPAGQREKLEDEVLRRALDVPFLGRLLRAAADRGPALQELPNRDFDGRPWAEGEREAHLTSAQRASGTRVVETQRSAAVLREPLPPPRLRAAERSLAHRTRSLAIVLDNVVSPRNVSAVLRSADAFGIQEVHLIQYEGKVEIERAITTHAHRWLDLHWYADTETALEALRARGTRLLAADFGPGAESVDAVPLQDSDGPSAPIALCFGSEQRGVSPALRAAADAFFYLPTSGFSAYLNVSVAVAISAFRLTQRMEAAGLRAPLEERDRETLRRAWYLLLARGDAHRAERYLAWLEHPPAPAPERRTRADPRA